MIFRGITYYSDNLYSSETIEKKKISVKSELIWKPYLRQTDILYWGCVFMYFHYYLMRPLLTRVAFRGKILKSSTLDNKKCDNHNNVL